MGDKGIGVGVMMVFDVSSKGSNLNGHTDNRERWKLLSEQNTLSQCKIVEIKFLYAAGEKAIVKGIGHANLIT